MNDAGFRIRVDDSLRGRFIAACKARDLTAAQVLREFMRTYVDASAAGAQLPLFVTEAPLDPSGEAIPTAPKGAK